MSKKVKKTCYLKTADWLINEEDVSFTTNLEELLSTAHEINPDIKDRKIPYKDDRIVEGRNYDVVDVGLYLHIVTYTPDEKANIVPIDDNKQKSEVGTTDAPQNSEFMDGDIIMYIKDNDITMTKSTHENAAYHLINYLIMKTFEEYQPNFIKFNNQISHNALKLLEKGVKEIDIDASAYREDLTKKETLINRIFPEDGLFASFLYKEKTRKEILKEQDLKVQLKISSEKLNNEELSPKSMHLAGEYLINESTGGYKIILKDGNTVSHEEIVMKKNFSASKNGKTIDIYEAWSQLFINYNLMKKDLNE